MCQSNYNGAKARSSRKLFDDERCRPAGRGKQGVELLLYSNRFPSYTSAHSLMGIVEHLLADTSSIPRRKATHSSLRIVRQRP